MLNKIFKFPHRNILGIAILLCLVITTIIGFFTPRIINHLFEVLEARAEVEKTLFLILLVFLFEYLIRICYQISINRFIQLFLHQTRSWCYENWIHSYEAYEEGRGSSRERFPLGEVLARMMNDTESVRELVSSGSFAVFIDIFFIISCFLGFLDLNSTSGLFIILIEVLVCILLIWVSRFMTTVYMRVRNATSLLSRALANITGGLKQLYHTPNNHFASRFSLPYFDRFLQIQLKANIWDASYFSVTESLYPLLLVCLVLIFPYSHISEMAALAAIIDLIQRSIQPIKSIAGKISNIQRAKTGLIRIGEFNKHLEKLPRSTSGRKMNLLNVDSLSVDLSEFTFHSKGVQGEFSLKNIHFTISKGEKVGVVGQSGCGKSTLMKILCGDILAKNIRVHFKSLNDSKDFSGGNKKQIEELKRYVSLVSQESHIFSSSLKFNISLSEQEAHFEEFWSFAKERISYLKRWGLKPDSRIEPAQLSLGQKQLLSGLRACYLKKPLVLMDEISSGLDSELEEALSEVVSLIQSQAITMSIAHRLETLIHSDKLIVMEKGRIVAQGTHQSLLVESSLYQELIARVKNE